VDGGGAGGDGCGGGGDGYSGAGDEDTCAKSIGRRMLVRILGRLCGYIGAHSLASVRSWNRC